MSVVSFVPFIAVLVGALAAVTFIVCAISSVAGIYDTHRFITYLKANYPGAWRALGEPHIIWNNSLKTIRALTAVVDSNVSEEISNETVAKMLRRMRRLNSVQSISFNISLVSTICFSVLANL